MAIVFIDGFDAADAAFKWNASPTTSAAGSGRFGTGRFVAFNTFSPSSMKKFLFQQLSQTFLGFAYNAGGTANPGGAVVYGDNGANAHVTVLVFNNAIAIFAGRAGAQLAVAPMSFVNNTWYYIEMWVQLATTGGRCQVRVDGVQVIDFTGNTMNGGTNTTVDALEIGAFSGGTSNCNFDDLYICDATGTTNNTFLGDVRVQTLSPTGVGSSTQLSPTGSVNNWSNVNDFPDGSATFNSSSVVGQRDTYGMADVLASTGTIFGIQDNIHAYKTDAGSGNIKPAIKSGATIAYDPTIALPSSNAWFSAIRETDPNTATTWTPASINAMEFGGEIA